MYVIHYWIFRAPPRKIHLWSFCARARRIHLWIYRARARNRLSSLYRGENFLCSGAENPSLELLRPSAEHDFLLYIGEKNLCARARRIHLWIYRARARNRFSSLYRRDKFLHSGAENPPLDLPRPGAETIFFSI